MGKEDSPFYGNIQPSQQELKNIEQTGGTKYELKEAGREAELTLTTGGEFGAGAGGGAGAGTGDTKPDITKPVPPKVKFKDTAEYKNLSQDMKDFVDLSYNLIEFGGEDEAKQFTNAITQAKGIADSYFKAQLTLALGDVQAAIAKQNGDYKTAKDLIDNANKELQDNLTANRDLLDLNNAWEIARAPNNIRKILWQSPTKRLKKASPLIRARSQGTGASTKRYAKLGYCGIKNSDI